MSEIKIEKGFPMPKGGRKIKYPIGSMSIGDSFFIANVCARAAISNSATRSGFKVTVHLVEENGVKGLRVWRIQ